MRSNERGRERESRLISLDDVRYTLHMLRKYARVLRVSFVGDIIILARIPNPSVFRSPFRSANRSTVSLLFLILPQPLEVFCRKCFEKNVWNRRGKKKKRTTKIRILIIIIIIEI